MKNFKKKYNHNSKLLKDAFIKNGYVIIKNIIDKKTVNKLFNFCEKTN